MKRGLRSSPTCARCLRFERRGRSRRIAPGLIAASRGEAIYLKYQCTQCHGISGIGTHDLTGAADHLGSPAAIEAWIRNPASITQGVAMPAWQGVLAEDDYAPLVEYVRRLGEQRVAAGRSGETLSVATAECFIARPSVFRGPNRQWCTNSR